MKKHKDFDYNVGDVVNGRKILNRNYKNYKRMYTVKCETCNNVSEIEEKRLEQHSCGVCKHKICKPFVNDLYTMRPDLLKYLKDINESIGVGIYSNKKITVVCPVCKSEKIMSIEKFVFKNQNRCDKCNIKKGSFGERLFSFILKENNINFQREFVFDWCKKYRYDFYLYELNDIVEIHGLQHYEECNLCEDTLKERQQKDKDKMICALSNNVSSYFIIDSRISTLEYFINSCKNNKQLQLLNLNLDLNYSLFFEEENADETIYYEIVDKYISGKSKKAIASEYNTTTNKIYSILKTPYAISKIKELENEQNKDISEIRENIRKERASSANYNLHNNKNIICLETSKIYHTYADAQRDTKCTRTRISACCNKKAHYTIDKHGNKFHWLFLEEYNLLNEFQINDIINFEQKHINKYNRDKYKNDNI